MNQSILSLAVFGVVAVSTAWGQVPRGYEIVHITDNPNDYSNRPQINNCGEIVFSTRINQSEPGEEIFVYDNGRLAQITRDQIRDAFADINDAGTVVWTHGADGFGGGTVAIYQDGTITELATGFDPEINNLGHIAWYVFDAQTCAFESDIFFYDGQTIERITDDGFSNQVVEINDYDQLVWTRFDFCVQPDYDSDVMLYSDGVTTLLTGDQQAARWPSINNRTQVAWLFQIGPGEHAIEMWEDGETLLLTEWGSVPRLNNLGDFAFFRWYESDSTYQIWLYRDGDFLQLTDDPFSNFDAAINDHGEVAWTARNVPESDIYFMRRVRDGDVDLDENVDLDDLASLLGCLTGPGETDRLCDCRFVDLDHDRDVDLMDFSTFQNLFTAEE